MHIYICFSLIVFCALLTTFNGLSEGQRFHAPQRYVEIPLSNTYLNRGCPDLHCPGNALIEPRCRMPTKYRFKDRTCRGCYLNFCTSSGQRLPMRRDDMNRLMPVTIIPRELIATLRPQPSRRDINAWFIQKLVEYFQGRPQQQLGFFSSAK